MVRILTKNKKEIDYKLSDILLDKKQLVYRALTREIMARTALWLMFNFEVEKVKMIYTKNLADALGIDIAYANRLLKQFVSFNLLKFVKIKGSNLVYFEPIYNNNTLALLEFKEVAKKTLGVK